MKLSEASECLFRGAPCIRRSTWPAGVYATHHHNAERFGHLVLRRDCDGLGWWAEYLPSVDDFVAEDWITAK